MNIQHISANYYNNNDEDSNIHYSTFDSPKCLDDFDINILNLNSDIFWGYSSFPSQEINPLDISHLSKMIANSKKTKFVILYPQNFQHNSWGNRTGNSSDDLKNRIPVIQNTLKQIVPNRIGQIPLIFEPTQTQIKNSTFQSDFHFKDSTFQSDFHFGNIPQNLFSVITSSIKSKKITTIKQENFYFTTINIPIDCILDFLETINLYSPKEQTPTWLTNYKFNDDIILYNDIEKSKNIILNEEAKIKEAEAKIEKNNYYKSILISNGPQLVNVVFDILQKILSCDLSNFVDTRHHDFEIKKESIIFIGEIKGENGGVRNSHISQLVNHLDLYKEENQNKQNTEIKGLLIINHQRSDPITERNPVNKEQIEKAIREKILIIETITLLSLFEQYLQKKLSEEDCLNIFSEKIGLLKMT